MTLEMKRQASATQDDAAILDNDGSNRLPINIALQGGGSHGAFTWGVLDRLIEDGRLDFAAISGTSAGAINAVAMADGWLRGGPDGARQKLEDFWRAVARNGRFSPIQRTPWDMLLGNWSVENSPGYQLFEAMSRLFSPYVANPFDLNPLRDVVASEIDFDNVRSSRAMKLFISATNVETGQLRVFEPHEITLDVVMASACLPQIFRAVEIEGAPYWDGGYGGNPALFPFFKANAVEDVLLVQINPIIREGTPRTAQEIQNRIDEITFNSGMLREFRAINFVKDLIADGKLSRDEYRDIRMHRIDADAAFKGLSASSKVNAEWAFLTYLRDLGRTAADDWLETGLPKVGKEPSVSISEDLDDEPHGKRPNYKRTLGRRVADFMAERGKPGARAKRQA